MNTMQFSSALGKLPDCYITEALTYRRGRQSRRIKWAASAACLGLIVAAAALTLPELFAPRSAGGPDPAGTPMIHNPNYVDQTGPEAPRPSPEPLQPPERKEPVIRWEGVYVNEGSRLAIDASRRYHDPELYTEEFWGEEEILDYYGWNLAPGYIPEGLSGGGKSAFAGVWREKATGEIIEEQAERGFWTDFWEDGSPKSHDDLYIPTGFYVTASRLGILRCGILRTGEVQTTDFGGVPVTIYHCAMPHGPFDPTQKAPNGLHNMPAGYYDLYLASFTLDGVEYEVEAQRLELEEVIKIVASILDPAAGEAVIVGAAAEKTAPPETCPETNIVPGFDLPEPEEP